MIAMPLALAPCIANIENVGAIHESPAMIAMKTAMIGIACIESLRDDRDDAHDALHRPHRIARDDLDGIRRLHRGASEALYIRVFHRQRPARLACYTDT